MNVHTLLDDATVALSSLFLTGNKFFADAIETDPLLDVAAEATAPDLPPVAETDPEDPESVAVDTPNGTYEAAYAAWDWKRASLPTIVFHHGSGENPFGEGRFNSTTLHRAFADPEDVNANIVAVRAPFHDRSAREYARAMTDLADFVGMLASSTAVVDALTHQLHAQDAPAVIVSGISLGGWVSTLHQATHDSAELYAPIFAGDRLGEMFVASAYRRMTGPLARENPEALRQALDYREAYAESDSPTRPLLARYDRIIEFGVQQPAFDPEDRTVIDYGHVTGSLQTEQLREHVVRAMIEAPGR